MEKINSRKRKKERSASIPSRRLKRKKSLSLTSIYTSERCSKSPSESSSEELLCNLGSLSPEDHKKYIDVIYQIRCESKYLINHITPIVLCCQYQNPIRCAYRLVHENVEHVKYLLKYDFQKAEPDERILMVMKNLTDNVVTLVRILKTVKIIQKKLDKINKALQKFELYVTHMKLILNYVINFLRNKKFINYKSNIYHSTPFPFHRLECRNCKEYVTFRGCRCTKWTYDTVPSQTIQNQLLSPAEDGPMPSNKSYINDWDYLKKRLAQISTWKPYSKKKFALKQLPINIDKKPSKVTTYSHSLSELVPAKSVLELNSSSERTEHPKQLLEEIHECVGDGLKIPNSISTNQIPQ